MTDDVGIDTDGMVQPDPALAACGGRRRWIGSSFLFIHLDLSLKARAGLPDGVGGEAWAGPWRGLLPDR